MAKLNANTVVRKGFEAVSLSAGDEVPEWAVDQVGEHLLDDEKPADGEKPARRTARKSAE